MSSGVGDAWCREALGSVCTHRWWRHHRIWKKSEEKRELFFFSTFYRNKYFFSKLILIVILHLLLEGWGPQLAFSLDIFFKSFSVITYGISKLIWFQCSFSFFILYISLNWRLIFSDTFRIPLIFQCVQYSNCRADLRSQMSGYLAFINQNVGN